MLGFLKKLWEGETDGLTAAAFIIGAASLASRLVGILRDRILASTFGAGTQLDAYYAAFRLPDFLYNLIILGAITAGFIPVFIEYLESKGKEEAWRVAESVLSLVGAVMGGLSLLLILLAPVLVPWTTPGFDPEKIRLTVSLSRIMFLSPFLIGLSAVMGGILQATKRFLSFALAPVLYNFGIIFGALFLSPRYGIAGVAWGVVIGAFLHLLAQSSVVFRIGMRNLPRPSFKSDGVRRILKLSAPRTLGLAVNQINLVILLILASTLKTGSVAVFNLASNLQSFPIGIIGVSFAVAALPALSRAISAKRPEEYRQTLVDTGRKIVFLILPITVIFLLLRAQIVRLIFGAGRFNWEDTVETAAVLGWFSVSLAAQSIIPLLTRAFYALQNTWTPLWIGIVAEVITAVCAFYFRSFLGVSGLAIAFSLAAMVQLVLLIVWLRKKFGPLGHGAFTLSLFKTVLACVALVGAAYPLRQWIGTLYPLTTFWRVALQCVVTCLGGGAAFFLAAWLLRSQEIKEFSAAIRRRLWRKVRIGELVEGVDEATGI